MDHWMRLQHDQITFGENGGTKTLRKDSIAFQTFIDNMNLVEIDMSNDLFSSENKRGGESKVTSKLERFIISEDLMLTNKDMVAIILPFSPLEAQTVDRYN